MFYLPLCPTRGIGKDFSGLFSSSSRPRSFVSLQELPGTQRDEQQKQRSKKAGESRESLTCLLKSSPFCSLPTMKQTERKKNNNLSINGGQHLAKLPITKDTLLAQQKQGEERKVEAVWRQQWERGAPAEKSWRM